MQRSKKIISSLVFSHLMSKPCFLASSFSANPQGAMIQLEEKARCEGRQEIERKETESRTEASEEAGHCPVLVLSLSCAAEQIWRRCTSLSQKAQGRMYFVRSMEKHSEETNN